MNQPEYIVVDFWAGLVQRTYDVLHIADPINFSNGINFQYGYITELNETLLQWNKVSDLATKKFPLVWLRQPFAIDRSTVGFYGTIEGLSVFVINNSTKNWKAAQRMDNNYKPIIYPIYRELLNQITLTPEISLELPVVPHKQIDRYYFGEDMASVLNDVVDCLEISELRFRINDNSNCLPFKNF